MGLHFSFRDTELVKTLSNSRERKKWYLIVKILLEILHELT